MRTTDFFRLGTSLDQCCAELSGSHPADKTRHLKPFQVGVSGTITAGLNARLLFGIHLPRNRY